MIEDALTGIARRYLNVPTLEARHSDSLDFHECAVWSLKGALEAAYLAGVAHARGEAQADQRPRADDG
jgi:hypothetical protein